MKLGASEKVLTVPRQFTAEWSRKFGKTEPFGWALRQVARHTSRPWLRLHALPESKRYASDDSERAEILRRSYILGNELLGEGAECWLVKSHSLGYLDDEISWSDEHAYAQLEIRDTDKISWRVHVEPVRRRGSEFDSTLRLIADDKTGPTIWMARGDGAVFAPYDGGFDLFPPSWNQVARFRSKYAAWLSQHPEEL